MGDGSVITHEMDALEFMAFVADQYKLQNISVALSIANTYLKAVDLELSLTDTCVSVKIGIFKALFVFGSDGKFKASKIY